MTEIVAYVREQGDRIYFQSPVGVYTPGDDEISNFAFGGEVRAFAEKLRDRAPNPVIRWMRGQYVEADNPNENRDQWQAGDLAIKRLTPILMPVTLMHDFSQNVGTIADTRLKLPAEDATVIRPRIDTVLALWEHRFPQVVEEAVANAQQGTLMQSMECISPSYDCSVCGMNFTRDGKGAERDLWCAHLRGEATASDGRAAARILRDVIFTGTGLILGTRGAHGAYPEAYLEVEALAELHAKLHERPRPRAKPPRRKNVMELEDSKYAELVAQAERGKRVAELEQKLAAAEQTVSDKEKAAEEAEAAKVKAEQERDKEKKDREEAEEKARVQTLRTERFESLGSAFTDKLDSMPTTKQRLTDQAGTLSDDEWKARLEELKESTGVDPTANKEGDGGGGGGGNNGGTDSTAASDTLLFDRETVASSNVSRDQGSGAASAPSGEVVGHVLGGLFGGGKKGKSSKSGATS